MGRDTLFMLMMAMLMSGCNPPEEPAARYEGRSETKKLQGADAVGYDGTAIRKSVDNTLDKTDQHVESVDKTLKIVEEDKK